MHDCFRKFQLSSPSEKTDRKMDEFFAESIRDVGYLKKKKQEKEYAANREGSKYKGY